MGELLQTIRKAVHLWWVVDNPTMVGKEDMRHFRDTSADFYARKGRKFGQELLALGIFTYLGKL